MTPEAEKNQFFTTHYQEGHNLVTVAFNPKFSLEDWGGFLAFARTRIDQGLISWELDLRKLPLLNSMLMGAMVSLNMVLLSRDGQLTLIVEQASRIAQLLALSKLDRIISVREV